MEAEMEVANRLEMKRKKDQILKGLCGLVNYTQFLFFPLSLKPGQVVFSLAKFSEF